MAAVNRFNGLTVLLKVWTRNLDPQYFTENRPYPSFIDLQPLTTNIPFIFPHV